MNFRPGIAGARRAHGTPGRRPGGVTMVTEIHADRVGELLHEAGDDFDVLSLDCFDTLIWRTTPEPPDLFCELRAPLSRLSRLVAEQTARERRLVAAGLGEVTLDDIYRCALPGADDAEIAARVAEELALEHRFCVAFAPTIELIRAAKRRGKRVIVVSDTYLTTEQLAALIAAKAGADVVASIDTIFCSSAHGYSKTTGLFPRVLKKLQVPAARVLHVGDNPKADVEAAREAGIRCVHLLQGDRGLLEQWRLELAAMVMADDALRHRAAPLLPHRPLLAARARAIEAPGERLGYATLGPLMHGFAHWVRDEARALAAGRRRVKVAFLMRDGHLPKLAYEAIAAAGDAPAVALEISRFTAFAATLDDESRIVSYLGMMSTALNVEPLARQLLFTPQEAAPLVARANQGRNPVHRLAEAVLQPAQLRRITERSATERRRLFAYLRRQVDLQPGDTLMLVDVGAAGTVQNRVQDVIAGQFGVQVEGRYLLLRDVPRAHEAKRGFFGPDRVDGRLLEALYTYIAIVEQMCTVDQGSVVGYSDDGEPRRKAADFGPQQTAARLRVQQACLRFIGDANAAATAARGPERAHGDWHGALAAFVRLLFLPMQDEADYFAAFAHDMNLGVQDTLPLVDAQAAAEDVRRIGPMYVKSSLRVFGPAELRRHGLDQSLLLLARRRFDLDLRPSDFRREPIDLPVMIVRGRESSIVRVEALATHDGWYAASVPVGRCEYAVGVLFGQLFEWLQLESARVVAVRRQFEVSSRDEELDLTAAAVHEGIRAESGGVLHCAARHAFTYFAPPAGAVDENCVLRVVFRPIAARAATPETKEGAAAAAAQAG
jgi:FMN phosphatase YigB (HAD superfamily)